jgi:hypothetical protein
VDTKTDRIRALNDELRKYLLGGLASAEWLCRTADRVYPARVRGAYRRLG